MAATLPLSSPHPVQVRFQVASEPQTQMMDQEAAERLNNQIDDELKVRICFTQSFYTPAHFE